MQTFYRCEEVYEEEAANVIENVSSAYYRTYGTRLRCRLFETTTPCVVPRTPSRRAAISS